MISIQCHRVGEWWSGKPEFENVSDPAGVYIPFKDIVFTLIRVHADFNFFFLEKKVHNIFWLQESLSNLKSDATLTNTWGLHMYVKISLQMILTIVVN